MPKGVAKERERKKEKERKQREGRKETKTERERERKKVFLAQSSSALPSLQFMQKNSSGKS